MFKVFYYIDSSFEYDFVHICAPCSELPFDMSTMVDGKQCAYLHCLDCFLNIRLEADNNNNLSINQLIACFSWSKFRSWKGRGGGDCSLGGVDINDFSNAWKRTVWSRSLVQFL